MCRYDPNKFEPEDDDSDMETDFAGIEKEERRRYLVIFNFSPLKKNPPQFFLILALFTYEKLFSLQLSKSNLNVMSAQYLRLI